MPASRSNPIARQGAELVVRLEEEAKARRNIADAIETTEGSLIFLRDGKLLRPYDSPHLDRYPEDGKERADKNLVYWALARESYIGFSLQQDAWCQRRRAEELRRADAPAAQGQDGHQHRPDQRQNHRRHDQEQRRRVRQETQSPGDQTLLHRRARPGQYHRLRRDRRVAGDISNPHAARRIERRAGGMGADGFGPDQRRQRRHRRQSAPSPWRRF